LKPILVFCVFYFSSYDPVYGTDRQTDGRTSKSRNAAY